MDNKEFNQLVKNAFENGKQYNFVKRVNIVDMDDDDVPTDVVSRLVDAEFEDVEFPKIKSGITLKDQKNERMTDVANNLAISANIRLNALIALFICGQGSLGSAQLKTDLPKEVHSVFNYQKGLDSVKTKLEFMESIHGVKYDRATLNGVLLTVLTGEVNVPKAKKAFKTATGLKVDVDNSSYNERTDTGMVTHPYVPNDKLILSHSKNDKSDKFYFANLPVLEAGEQGAHGLVTYIKDDIAWAVMRGIPVLLDPLTFATITYM